MENGLTAYKGALYKHACNKVTLQARVIFTLHQSLITYLKLMVQFAYTTGNSCWFVLF
jgi:hypothetical protein